MNTQSWLAPTAVVVAIIMASALSGPLSAQVPGAGEKEKAKAKQPATKDAFGLTKVHEFHLELTAKEWTTMQMVRGGMPFGGQKKQPEKPGAEPLEFHKGASAEFPWAHAEFTAEGKTFKNVGVRYKGNFTYAAASSLLRRPMQIELDHYENGKRFHGLRKLSFANGIADPARVRESLAFAVFRAAGVPAPRTAFANVTLTVPGKFNKEYVGLYTLIEHVGNPFLKEHFKSAEGLLLKPEGRRGLEYLGEDWGPYEMRYRPKSEVSREQKKRFIAFARLVNKADDEQFKKEIGSYLDVDAFLRFLAVNALIVNLDSFLAGGHNYYLYLRPDTNQFLFLPWDMDVAFGVVPMAGPGEQQANLSINHPHVGQNKLIDRLLAMKDANEKYQKVLKDLSASCFTKEKLLADIDAIEAATKEHRAEEKKAAAARKEGIGMAMGGGLFAQALPLRTFVDKRTASVAAQLAGTSKGYVPILNFGPGGPKGGPGGFGPGKMLAKPLLAALDTDKDGKLSRDKLIAAAKKFFADCDKDKKGKLDEKAIADGVNRLFPPPPEFGPPKGGPGGFSPGLPIARTLMKRAGTDKDGKLTLDEFVAVTEALFKELDKDQKGSLDEDAVAAGINLMFGAPAFGPPAFGPPDKKGEEPRDEEVSEPFRPDFA